MVSMNNLAYTSEGDHNWLYRKYYAPYAGANYRYWTFQLALNILFQRKKKRPVIVETGCQRAKDDIGAGMSSSIFGEYCYRYRGKLYSIDLYPQHLEMCKHCTAAFSSNIEYVLSDSITWLRETKRITADLLYLDSLDYPISPDGFLVIDEEEKIASQRHCLNEFLAALGSGKLTNTSIVIADDNQLPGGGKPALLKEHLAKSGWKCLMDFQQTVWCREL